MRTSLSKMLAQGVGAGAALVLLLFVASVVSGACATTPAQEAAKRNEAVMGVVIPSKPFTPLCSTVTVDGGTGCPASWYRSQLYFDPLNVTSGACASDGNLTCTLNNCSTPGDGPCLSYAGLATKWGTLSPSLQSAITNVTMLSADSAGDPVNIAPFMNNGYMVFQCTPTQIGTVTLGAVTAKNRASPQLLNAVMVDDGGAIAAGEFLVNTTQANSEAWVYKNVSGSTWAISQPLAPASSTALGLSYGHIAAENDSWTIGDTVNVFTLPDVYVANINPTQGNFTKGGAHSTAGGVYVYQCNLQSLQSGVFGAVSIGSQVALLDTKVQSILGGLPSAPVGFNVSTPAGAYTQELYNSWPNNGMWPLGLISTARSGVTNPGAAYIAGGVIANGNNVPTRLGWVSIEQDAILGASNGWTIESGALNGVYVETSQTLLMLNGQVTVANDINGGNARLWGPGAINIEASVRFAYPAGASGAANSLLFTGGISVSGGTKGCVGIPTDAAAPTCNQAFTAANLDSNLGTTSGCLFVPGGGSMCNVGQ